jgi:hypothetical protein
MRNIFVALAMSAVALAGCGGGDQGPDTGEDVLLMPPPEGAGLQLGMTATIEPGQEVTYCQYVVLPAGDGIDVAWFEHAYSPGSHHLLLYTTDLTAADVAGDLARFDCDARDTLTPGGIAYAAQVATGQSELPDGVAMHFAGEEVVLVQSHYLNTTSSAIDADVRLNLWRATEPVTAEAGTLFFYDYAIAVPAHGQATARMHCVLPEDVQVSYAMSHMHKRGVGYRSWLTGGDLEEPRSLFETDRWEGVEPSVMTPPLAIAKGQAVDFECDFVNDGGAAVIEGPSASKNEMCMFVGAYWPKMEIGAEQCTLEGSGPVYAGTKTCAETVACVQGTDDLVEREECLLDTCAASNVASNALNVCIFQSCRAFCPDGVECPACVAEHCSPQYGACQQATCG